MCAVFSPCQIDVMINELGSQKQFGRQLRFSELRDKRNHISSSLKADRSQIQVKNLLLWRVSVAQTGFILLVEVQVYSRKSLEPSLHFVWLIHPVDSSWRVLS